MSNAPLPSLMPVYARIDLAFERGEGAWLYADDGRAFLDFGSGIAVCGLGYAHPHLSETLRAQADKVWHVSNLYRIEELDRLADRLVAHSFAETVFACNSGAEAMEACIKLIRRHHFARGRPEKNRIVTFEGAFHGRTMATISATGQSRLTEGFAPLLDGFDTVPFGDLEAVEAAIDERTAAIMLEPIQGEGGVRPFDLAFLRGLRELCDERDLLLAFDEIQCGLGRTGALFAHQRLGVVPDVMGIAKGLGGGFPIGACLATARAASGMTKGTHGSTFGGNPLACAIANAVLDVTLEEGFLASVRAKGDRLLASARELASAHPALIAEARGLGLMVGLRLTDALEAPVFAGELRNRGLLTVPAADNVVRLLPPLIIGDSEIETALRAIREALEAA